MESGLSVLAEFLAEQPGQPQHGVHLHSWRLLGRKSGERVEEGPGGTALEVRRVGAFPIGELLWPPSGWPPPPSLEAAHQTGPGPLDPFVQQHPRSRSPGMPARPRPHECIFVVTPRVNVRCSSKELMKN